MSWVLVRIFCFQQCSVLYVLCTSEASLPRHLENVRKSLRDFMRMGYHWHNTEPIHQQSQSPNQACFLYKQSAPAKIPQWVTTIKKRKKKAIYCMSLTDKRFPLIKAESRIWLSGTTAQGFVFKKQMNKKQIPHARLKKQVTSKKFSSFYLSLEVSFSISSWSGASSLLSIRLNSCNRGEGKDKQSYICAAQVGSLIPTEVIW